MRSHLEILIRNDPVDEQRIRAKLATARACLMNNCRWREVLSVLARSAHLNTPIRWRFVRDDRTFFESVPSLHGLGLLPERLPDELPYPYGPYREIDWIEVPVSAPTTKIIQHNNLEALAGELESLGQLPMERTDAGLRISGYVW